MAYFRCKPTAEEPPAPTGDLRVFDYLESGFFHTAMLKSGFNFNSQIAVTDGSAELNNIVQNYPNNKQIIGSGNSQASWFTSPFLELTSENVMKNKIGDNSNNDITFYIPIKHMTDISGLDYEIMTTDLSVTANVYLYKIENGELVQVGSLNAGGSSCYNKYYTFYDGMWSPAVEVDYIGIKVSPMSAASKVYWRFLCFYQDWLY